MGTYFDDIFVKESYDPGWERTDMGWSILPWGFRDLLLHIQKRYQPPGGIIITENGCAHEPDDAWSLNKRQGALLPVPYSPSRAGAEDWDGETFDDRRRVRFLEAYLAGVHAAITMG